MTTMHVEAAETRFYFVVAHAGTRQENRADHKAGVPAPCDGAGRELDPARVQFAEPMREQAFANLMLLYGGVRSITPREITHWDDMPSRLLVNGNSARHVV